jgi:hypothetical protein
VGAAETALNAEHWRSGRVLRGCASEAFSQLRRGLAALWRCLVPGIGSAIGSAFLRALAARRRSGGLWAGQLAWLSTSSGSAIGSAVRWAVQESTLLSDLN